MLIGDFNERFSLDAKSFSGMLHNGLVQQGGFAEENIQPEKSFPSHHADFHAQALS